MSKEKMFKSIPGLSITKGFFKDPDTYIFNGRSYSIENGRSKELERELEKIYSHVSSIREANLRNACQLPDSICIMFWNAKIMDLEEYTNKLVENILKKYSS